jgi:hypothetical protein
MNGSCRIAMKLDWQELFSPEEVKRWALKREKPERLQNEDFAFPGVYRFVFPMDADGTDPQTFHCYVGETGDVGKRICDYFVLRGVREVRNTDGTLKDYDGWPVRGEIQNSRGVFSIQILRIEGCLEIYGVKLNATCFDDHFSRILLENWAILHAKQIDKYHVLNCGVDQGIKYLQRMGSATESRKR